MGWTAASLDKLRQTHRTAVRQHYDQMDHASAVVADKLEGYARERTRWQSHTGQQKKKIVSLHMLTRSKARMFLRGLSTKSKWGTHNVLASLEFGTRPHRIWARKAPGRFGMGASYSAVGARALAFRGRYATHVDHPGTRPYMTLRGSWQANGRLLPRTFSRGMQAVASRFGA